MNQRLAITTASLMGLLVLAHAPRASAGCPEVKLLSEPSDGSSSDEDGGTETTDPGGMVFEEEGCASDPEPEPDESGLWINMRAGAEQTRDALVFVACVETLFVGPLSAELCGSGRGLLLDKTDGDPALTAYRVRLRLARVPWGRAWIAPIVQAGMSELRVGQSGAGFLPGRGSPRQLALGPAAGAALQLVWPLGAGVELIGDIHLDAAWIPRAGELMLPQEELQPSLGTTLGIGF